MSTDVTSAITSAMVSTRLSGLPVISDNQKELWWEASCLLVPRINSKASIWLSVAFRGTFDMSIAGMGSDRSESALERSGDYA